MRPRIRSQYIARCARLRPSFRWYSFRLLTEGWLGWVGLVAGYLPRGYIRLPTVAPSSTNRVRRWLTSLTRPPSLPTKPNRHFCRSVTTNKQFNKAPKKQIRSGNSDTDTVKSNRSIYVQLSHKLCHIILSCNCPSILSKKNPCVTLSLDQLTTKPKQLCLYPKIYCWQMFGPEMY